MSNDLSSPIQSIPATDSNSARITTDQLTTTGGHPLFYRVVVYGNGAICPNKQSDITFYEFNGLFIQYCDSHLCIMYTLIIGHLILDTRVISPNSYACYDIPSPDMCSVTSLRFVWLDTSTDTDCVCPVHNSSDGRAAFMACDCIRHSLSDIVPRLMENGSICVSTPLGRTVVYYVCTNDSCGTPDCYISTILESHIIILEGNFKRTDQ